METTMFDANYSNKPRLCIVLSVVELCPTIELIQQSVIQWTIVKETILMTPEQTVQLINLLGKKRTEAGLSANEVARRAGVDPGTVWRIEQGLIPTPKAESLKAIGEVLGIPSIDLFTIVGWIPSHEMPSIGPYLRVKYRLLPEEAVQEIEAHFQALARKYDVSIEGNNGPLGAASASSAAPDPPLKEA
jgi:transcriptional regulator with XRE-family HTH domain